MNSCGVMTYSESDGENEKAYFFSPGDFTLKTVPLGDRQNEINRFFKEKYGALADNLYNSPSIFSPGYLYRPPSRHVDVGDARIEFASDWDGITVFLENTKVKIDGLTLAHRGIANSAYGRMVELARELLMDREVNFFIKWVE